MEKKLSIVLIGAGNVSYHLAKGFRQCGHRILAIVARNLSSAKAIADKKKAEKGITTIRQAPEADVYIIAVNDDNIVSVFNELNSYVTGKIVVHTSGSTPLNVLKSTKNATGVIYPLQTFSVKRDINLAEVPFCIEASDKKTLTILKRLAGSLTKKVYSVNSSQRLQLHLAAVFANNFSNALLVIAEKLLKEQQLPFSMLKPLINETAAKLADGSPMFMQTGPARRGDVSTMKKHEKSLQNNRQWKRLYRLMSSIIKENT